MTIVQKPANPCNWNTGRSFPHIIRVVIHVEAGTEIGTISWFANASAHVSAHYSVGQDGRVYQHVQEKDTAWHAGLPWPYKWADPTHDPNIVFNPNSYSIGIEHEGLAGQVWTVAQMSSSAALISDICERYGLTVDREHVVGHHEIYAGHMCPGTGCDMDSLVALANTIRQSK